MGGADPEGLGGVGGGGGFSQTPQLQKKDLITLC